MTLISMSQSEGYISEEEANLERQLATTRYSIERASETDQAFTVGVGDALLHLAQAMQAGALSKYEKFKALPPTARLALPPPPRSALRGAGSGVSIASSVGNRAPAQIVRMIKPGEKVADIVNEGKALTFETGNEHALVTLANGERAIVSGGPGGIDFKPGAVTRIFGHTHPTNAPPSADDFVATSQLGQSKQYIFHGGEVTVVRPPK
jgi:hypothetical protein